MTVKELKAIRKVLKTVILALSELYWDLWEDEKMAERKEE